MDLLRWWLIFSSAVGLVAASRTGFLLTGPKLLLLGSVETFCVSVEVTSTAHCTLDLLATDSDTIYAGTKHRMQGPKDCIKLAVPTSLDEYRARLRLRIKFDGVTDYKIDSVKEVVLVKTDDIDLIQTDKAWYTPGQLVRFRVLSLDRMLYPIMDPVSRIWVEDPTGITVAQWTNSSTVHGIHQMELQLSPEPVQGRWRIMVKRESAAISVQEFEVREFVLPKFEVNINPPPFIRFNQASDNSVQKINIGICAKYSYGQPVRGSWKAEVEVTESDRYRWSWRYQQQQPSRPIKLERKGLLNGDSGCYQMRLAGDELGLQDPQRRQKQIKVTAFVTEQGTDIEMNSTWTTEVKMNSLKMTPASSSTTFKNGLPYYGKIKVLNGDDSPAPGIDVEVCAQPEYAEQPLQELVKPDRRAKQQRPSGAGKYCGVRQSDSFGIVSFELLSNEAGISSYDIKAKVVESEQTNNIQTQFTIHSSYSPSESYLAFVPPAEYPRPVTCNSMLPLKLYFTVDREINFNLHYMVVSRGDVISTGVKQVKFREEDNVDLGLGDSLLNKRPSNPDGSEGRQPFLGDLDLDIEITSELSPKFSLLAYYVRDDKEVVTASLEVPVQNCFPNPVTFTWSSNRKQPGQNVTMQLTGGPGSFCGYSVVDRSVTYMRPDLQLTESKVYSHLPNFHIESGRHPFQVTPEWEYCRSKHDELDLDLRRRKRFFIPWFRSQYKDAMEAFDDTGLMVMSDLTIETRPCPERTRYRQLYSRHGIDSLFDAEDMDAVASRTIPMARPLAVPIAFRAATVAVGTYEAGEDLSSTVSVRTYFPETWLWDLIPLDPRGHATNQVELPHTVTTWVGRALCVSESSGFGMSPLTEIEAFQLFFLELHLPYATKRGEKLQIKVSVFNYAGSDLPVRLTLAYSEQFELLSDTDSAILCIPAKNNKVHQFLVHAIELGHHNVTVSAVIDDSFPGECGPQILPSGKDSVVKELLVQPEGFPVERVYSHMACPQDFEDDKELKWDLSLPEDLVEGSARAWVTAVGDLMGPALQGLSGLVQMPMGCGEQNMILFTPNIYVVQYLESTGQLEAAIKKKAVGYMKSGYQRELTYRHADGSYSAFGKSDPSGSLWLTAFVVKSFAAARRYIDIDANELKTSVQWLRSKQLENGCFPVVGTVLHRDLKGGLEGSEDLTPLTAYALIALLETYGDDPTESVAKAKLLEDTLPCLEPEESGPQDVYTVALTAYALTLAGRLEQARTLVDWLLQRARNDQSMLWWQKAGSGPALSVELSAYVLLSLVKLGGSEDLVHGRSIVRWLSKQRNSDGGFVSTQDTVVALQAIASYAALIGAQPVDMRMLVTAADLERTFRIVQEDRLVQRRIDLPLPLAPSVSIDSVGEGGGCAIVQATLRYNVHTAPPSAAFELTHSSTPLSTGNCGAHQLTICSRYLLQQSSNMALFEINMISGYEVDKFSLEALTINKSSGVKRHEVKGDVVVIYFDQISSDADTCFSLIVRPAFEVNDVKDSNIKIYDYYQPEHSKSISYHLPSACILISEIEPLPPLPLPVEQVGVDEGLVEVVEEPFKKDIAFQVGAEEAVFSEADAVPNPVQQDARVEHFMSRTATDLMEQMVDQASLDAIDTDLEVPEGPEGPVPVYARPEQALGCPRCVSMAPEDFLANYCQAETTFWVEVRPTRGQRLRLLYDVSLKHAGRQIKMNSSVELQLQSDCSCDILKELNRNVTVIGLPLLPHPIPPQKLAVGPELLIIDQTPKQLNIKSIRVKQCRPLLNNKKL